MNTSSIKEYIHSVRVERKTKNKMKQWVDMPSRGLIAMDPIERICVSCSLRYAAKGISERKVLIESTWKALKLLSFCFPIITPFDPFARHTHAIFSPLVFHTNLFHPIKCYGQINTWDIVLLLLLFPLLNGTIDITVLGCSFLLHWILILAYRQQ